MEISQPCVVTLTWTLKDSLGRLLDELDRPVEFLVGGDDLLPVIEEKLEGRKVGAVLDLNLEPEHAFGHYDEQWVFILPKSSLPDSVTEGMLIEARSLPDGSTPGLAADHLLTITEIYPEHVVIDGNHPLAGMALRLHLKVVRVRAAQPAEIKRKSVGAGFFRLKASPTGPSRGLH
ncbi:MAG: peptidylprolyl isomerase [Burkholderiaceae bacterium]|jgi:FKBP-type peptidyl-prolyl cis-trans isomerase SlyD|nr:MAG: peptidylprolyl isomerase [Burkholderiaceae bacterium]